MSDLWCSLSWARTSVTRLSLTVFASAILVCAIVFEQQADAQPGGYAQPTPEQMQRFREMRGRGRRNRREPPMGVIPAQPAPEKKEEKKDEKPKEKEGKKEEETKTIKRPTDGTGKLDPNRIRLHPDKNGLVQLNYNGLPWADVLQDFADAANFSFDWQELPADNLNLVTQKKYNLQQARDLLNRHLLARGFTLIVQGEVLSAVKISKLDPSLVPRVEADELEDYSPHDFVRVRFQLPPSIEPAKAKDDVTVLLSPNAKVTPLLNTKQLLVIDTVANLRSVRDLIYSEQTASDSIVKPEIYHIRYRRAEYVADQVMIVLGMDPSSRKSPQELQLETQRMQLYMQMQQKGKDVSKLMKKGGPEVFIAVDQQQNTLLINAPPELLATIQRTIQQFDQPADGGLAAGTGQRSTRPHKTKTASTDAVVSALTEFGQLDPRTRLQSDSKTKTIFVYGTEEDHQRVEEMINKIDSTGREIHVIPLRRYAASQVAGTLMSIFVVEEKKKDNNNFRSRRYGFYGMPEEEETNELGFKAMPDVETNRLILWANSEEITRVNKMLRRLGETPGEEVTDTSNVRVLRARTPEETARLLEQLKSAYPGKLNIDNESNQSKPEAKFKTEEKVTQSSPLGTGRMFLAQHTTPASKIDEQTTSDSPDVNVTVTEDGRIVISSDDPAALDKLEKLVNVIEPPRKEFDYYKLKHVYASGVVLKLERYFSEELKGQTESVFDEWGEYQGKKDKQTGPMTLGKRELLRFLYEDYTNTVIVQGASASQLVVIEQLIKIYDQAPEPANYLARKTEVIKLQYSRAQDISASLKEVYRELLSSKDKEFQDKEGSRSIISNSEKTYVFGEVQRNAEGEEQPVLIKFDGILSIGVDEISNSLIISARKEVLDSVKETVNLLDVAATPDTTIHVHRVGGTLSADTIQKTLKGSLGEPWPGGKPLQPGAGQRGRGGGGQQRGNRNQGNNNNRRRRGR